MCVSSVELSMGTGDSKDSRKVYRCVREAVVELGKAKIIDLLY